MLDPSSKAVTSGNCASHMSITNAPITLNYSGSLRPIKNGLRLTLPWLTISPLWSSGKTKTLVLKHLITPDLCIGAQLPLCMH